MKSLLFAECFKLFRQSKTYYAVASLLIIEGIILISAYFEGTNIINILLDNLRKTFYLKGNLLNGNLLQYLVLNTLWFHLPLIIMIVVSGMLTAEYKDKTVQTIFLQPVRKWKWILSKYIIAVGFTAFIVGLLFITSYWLCNVFFGKGDLVVYLDGLSFFSAKDASNRIQWAFLAGTISMVFFAVSSLTIAVILKDVTKTWIVCALFLIICNVLLKIDLGTDWLNQFSFFKLNDTWQYFFQYDIPYSRIWLNWLISLFYIITIASVGIIIFQKRDIG
ncbi:MAG: ABC transporter permease [Chitinophagia bacterium]|nr:ABC transporter permease [Chitinophagia bacterium]